MASGLVDSEQHQRRSKARTPSIKEGGDVALMPSYCILSYYCTFVLLFKFCLCIVTHAHTTHVIIYKLYVVENKRFSVDSMCVCEAKRPAHANLTGVIASDATHIKG